MSDTDWHAHRIVALVKGDLQAALGAAFEETSGFSPAIDLPDPIETPERTVVAWEYRGRERLNPLSRAQFQAERREVTVRGITVVVGADSNPRFHRYIDWVGVYDQLGLVPGRPTQGVALEATIGRDAENNDALILVPDDTKPSGSS